MAEPDYDFSDFESTRDFNADEVPDSFELLPPDWYTSCIIGACFKPTKKGDGTYFEATYQVLEGECKDRLVWSRHNVENQSDLAVTITRAELANICKAVGVNSLSSSSELLNIPLEINVRQKSRSDNGELANEVKGWRASGFKMSEGAVFSPSGKTTF